jgi:hypothetical protein
VRATPPPDVTCSRRPRSGEKDEKDKKGDKNKETDRENVP